jgi:hypothetical protein
MRTGGPEASRSPQLKWDRPLAFAAAALTVVAPLAIGSVHPWTQVALSAYTLVLTAVYGVMRGRFGVRVVPFAPLLAATAAVTALQLVPLPAPLVHLVSPSAWEIRSAVGASWWMPLTLDVPATVLALARALAGLGLLLVVGGLSRSRSLARRLLLTLALLGGGFAMLAFAQRAVGAQAIYGLYRPRSTPGFGFFGSFVDVNHAASLLALTALVACGLGFELRGPRRLIVFACAVLATAALLFSTSRGGLVGFAVGGLILSAVLLARALGRARGLTSAVVLLAVTASVALWAGEGLRARFLPSTANPLWSNQKTRGWRDGLRMAADYAGTGVGRGAFEAPLRAYREGNEGVRLVYAENFIVQYTAEWGLPATAALLLLALWSMRRVLAHGRDLSPGAVGAGAGVVAVVVHELMDFGTEMPGIALPTVLALGIVAGRAAAKEEHCPRVKPRHTLPVAAAWATVVLLALWAAPHTLDEDDIALHAAVRNGQPVEAALAAAIARHPADDYLELLAAEDGLRRHDAHVMHHLNRALQLHPANWQTHQLAARLLAGVGRQRQAALEYRLALQYGMLPDYSELTRVLGRSVLDAVPQEPPSLVSLARNLVASGHVDDAVRACARAGELAPRPEPVLAACTTAALESNTPAFLTATAQALAAEASETESFALAARALQQAGQPNTAAAVIAKGIKGHGPVATLVLGGARLRMQAGDLAGARAMLAHNVDGAFSLAERQQMEELLAEVADRAGDIQAAVLARARARLIARRLRETSFSPPDDGRP